MPDLVLASSSPRRKALLRSLGLDFAVTPPTGVDEQTEGGDPTDAIVSVAVQKSRAVAGDLDEGLVIGADTAVLLDGKILGKPKDEADARGMLGALCGREHVVITGVCVFDAARELKAYGARETEVTMASYEEWAIEMYLASGEYRGKAGSYAIQGIGALLTQGIVGSYSNVVGFPVEILDELFGRLGYSIWNFVL